MHRTIHLLTLSLFIYQGAPYLPDLNDFLDERERKWKFVKVSQCGHGEMNKPFYTIIRAKVPASWGVDVQREEMKMDIKGFNLKTSLGPSQFHVQVQNRLSFKKSLSSIGKGRPRKVNDLSSFKFSSLINSFRFTQVALEDQEAA